MDKQVRISVTFSELLYADDTVFYSSDRIHDELSSYWFGEHHMAINQAGKMPLCCHSFKNPLTVFQSFTGELMEPFARLYNLTF